MTDNSSNGPRRDGACPQPYALVETVDVLPRDRALVLYTGAPFRQRVAKAAAIIGKYAIAHVSAGVLTALRGVAQLVTRLAVLPQHAAYGLGIVFLLLWLVCDVLLKLQTSTLRNSLVLLGGGLAINIARAALDIFIAATDPNKPADQTA